MEAGGQPRRLRRRPTLGIVFEPETIFTAALSGLPGNKASIDPPNEPTQQSLLLDLHLLKSGEEESSSFSTFPGICRLIDCFARAVCIFWNAWDLGNIRMGIILIGRDNERTEMCPGDSGDRLRKWDNAAARHR